MVVSGEEEMRKRSKSMDAQEKEKRRQGVCNRVDLDFLVALMQLE